MKYFNHNIINNNIPTITTKSIDGTRYYLLNNGLSLPSVTSVVGFEKNIFFAEWRKRNPTEAKRVTARGTLLHEIIEQYLNNTLTDKDLIKHKKENPNILKLFVKMKKYIDKIDNIYALEIPLISEKVGLAGRVDCVAEYDGVLSIIDFKGSTKQKEEKDIDNYFMQATAYSLLWEDMTGIKINDFSIIIGCENSDEPQLFFGKTKDYVSLLKNSIDIFVENMGNNNVQQTI